MRRHRKPINLTVTVTYTSAQVAGDTNILAIGWNNTTSNITSVTDSAGNTYQLAVPTARGSGLSQAIYYASNIKAAAAGANTVTVTFNASTPFIDIRALEYSGLDPVNPFDVGTSASGNGTSANSGTVTTTAAGELIFGAGMTGGVFSAAGTNFTNRIITAQDGDIAEDRFVTTTGSYSATASLSGSASWLMQVATFKAAAAPLLANSALNSASLGNIDQPQASFETKAVDSEPGALRSTAPDEDPNHDVTPEGSFATNVADVVPVTVSGPASTVIGDPYTISLAGSDLGDATILCWTINWGDGAVDTLMGNPGSATHVFGKRGSFTIQANATNEDGTFNASCETTVGVHTEWLVVESFMPTETGFRVRFNHAFDPSTFSIYAGQGNARGSADVLLFGQGVGQIDDSIVIDEDFAGFAFLREGATRQSGNQHTSPAVMLLERLDPTANSPMTAELTDCGHTQVLRIAVQSINRAVKAATTDEQFKEPMTKLVQEHENRHGR